jgi:hypothetical protein
MIASGPTKAILLQGEKGFGKSAVMSAVVAASMAGGIPTLALDIDKVGKGLQWRDRAEAGNRSSTRTASGDWGRCERASPPGEAMFSMPSGLPCPDADGTRAEVAWSALHGLTTLQAGERLRASHAQARLDLVHDMLTQPTADPSA